MAPFPLSLQVSPRTTQVSALFLGFAIHVSPAQFLWSEVVVQEILQRGTTEKNLQEISVPRELFQKLLMTFF